MPKLSNTQVVLLSTAAARPDLEGGPSYRATEDPWSDSEYGRGVYDYYGARYPYV